MRAVVFLLLVLAILGVVSCGCCKKKTDTKAKEEGEKLNVDKEIKKDDDNKPELK